jgi:hypothetical protein
MPGNVVREGPVGVEIVRRKDGTTHLNYFNNGIQFESHRTEHRDITMPEALILLAVHLRMGKT